MNPAEALTLYLLNIRLDINVPRTPGSLLRVFFSDSMTKISHVFLTSPMCSMSTTHLIFLYLITPINTNLENYLR